MVKNGLYSPEFERDACGIGFVPKIKSNKSHQIISDALTILENMEHRGACGCENNTGDGAGILIQIPHEFMAERCKALPIALGEPGSYGIGALFTSPDPKQQAYGKKIFARIVAEEGQQLLGWRPVKTNNE